MTDKELLEYFDRRFDNQDRDRKAGFDIVNQGIGTIHATISALERAQTEKINLTRIEILDVLDSRMVRHKAEQLGQISETHDLAEKIKDKLIAHVSSPVGIAHPVARNGTANGHGQAPAWKTWVWLICTVCGAVAGAVMVLRIISLIAHSNL